jgi:hypothetical protein
MQNNDVRSRIPGYVLAALMTVLLAGCGGGDEETANASPLPPSAPGSSGAPPAVPPMPQPRAATLEWTAPTTTTDGSSLVNLAGYRIYYGPNVTSLTKSIYISNPSVLSYVVEDLAPGTYYFAVTAVNANNHESERSNAGRKTIT